MLRNHNWLPFAVLFCFLALVSPRIANAEEGPPGGTPAVFFTDVSQIEEEPPDTLLTQTIEGINAERAARGLSPLTADDSLMEAAAARAAEAAENFDHIRPDGRKWYSILDDSSIFCLSAGENIAFGQTTAADVVSDWMQSESHKENILRPGFLKTGIGLFIQDGIYYWAQLFISD